MNAGRSMVRENRVEDPQKLEERLEDLRVRWEAITTLAATKQDRYVKSSRRILIVLRNLAVHNKV